MVRKTKKRGYYQCREILVCKQWLKFQKHCNINANYGDMTTRIDKGNIDLIYDNDIH